MVRHLKLQVYVDAELKRLLQQEDLDRDLKITKDDLGPKSFYLHSIDHAPVLIEGHYPLSNLLQHLAYAHQKQHKTCIVCLSKLYQNPVDQTTYQIHHHHWAALTRTNDARGLLSLLEDPKHHHLESYFYTPFKDEEAYSYFAQVAHAHPFLKLKVKTLPLKIQAKDQSFWDTHPGLLSLSLNAWPDAGNPYVVPGGRFNEMYGWDSYFIIEGLLLSGKVHLAISMLKHLLYQVQHYGQILNANRSYYLLRSQPPLLSSIVQLLKPHIDHSLLKEAVNVLIDEYQFVWLSSERCPEKTLSRYYGFGVREPIEVEANHFNMVYQPFAQEQNITVEQYRKLYLSGQINEPKLDEFFIHDQSMRESGHDTTYRLWGKSAHLYPVDLNCLLYKYEKDIATLIKTEFNNHFIDCRRQIHNAENWDERALMRQKSIHKLLWNSENQLYCDYNFVEKKQSFYESATTFYPLFARVAKDEHASILLEKALHRFEEKGGLVSSTQASRGALSVDRPQRQWDYPFGWAPHQMLFWKGALNYGYASVAQRLAYKWLLMLTHESRDYNGVITEKYDVVRGSHQIQAEYGNVGDKFKYFPDGGFGWSNASYLVGQQILTDQQLAALKEMKDAKLVFS